MMPAVDGYKEPNYIKIGELMYHIGSHANSKYKLGSLDKDDNPKNKEKAETGTLDADVIRAFKDFGYKVGEFKSYSYSGVTSSIDKKKPVMAGGYTDETTILFIFKKHSGGHYWVIDGYFQREIKNKATGEIKKDPSAPRYVHCNMGWGGTANGWYIDGVFNTNAVPWKDNPRSAESYNYKYFLRILTDITY